MVAVMSELLEAPRRAIEGQASRRMKKRKAKVVEKKRSCDACPGFGHTSRDTREK
jgi:hypothetical protein